MKKFYTVVILICMAACAHLNQNKEYWITNANNESIYVKVDGLYNTPNQKLVFIEHGLASNLNHQTVETAKKAFLNNGYTVITFDARYSLGNSGNEVKFVTLSTFKQDLETVIDWAKDKPFYSKPFALSGHSLGGASVIAYSAEHPSKVNMLIPITPVISGTLWENSCMKNLPDFCPTWKKNGSYEYTDTKNHKTAVIPYKVVTGTKTYDATKLASKINAKTLLIAAQDDIIINPEDLKNLSHKIKDGQSATISASGHNFEERQNRQDLYQVINAFLR